MNPLAVRSTVSLSNLIPLRWSSFSQAATASFAALAATFTPLNITVSPIQWNTSFTQNNIGQTTYTNQQYGTMQYQIGVSGKLPAWVQPGVTLSITASVTVTITVNGTSTTRSYDLSGNYTVTGIDPSGTWFTVNAPTGDNNGVSFTTPIALTALDSGSGAETTPLVSLVLQCQKAMFGCSAGTVTLAPVVDQLGNAPNTETLVAGVEYEITTPQGAKFDLADWSVKTASAGTLYVRFI